MGEGALQGLRLDLPPASASGIGSLPGTEPLEAVPLPLTLPGLPYLPELPTLHELGHPDFVATTWFSLSGPAGLPRDIVGALNREVIRAMPTPLVKKQIEFDAIETKPMTPAEVTQFSQSEIDRWSPLIKRVMAEKQ